MNGINLARLNKSIVSDVKLNWAVINVLLRLTTYYIILTAAGNDVKE